MVWSAASTARPETDSAAPSGPGSACRARAVPTNEVAPEVVEGQLVTQLTTRFGATLDPTIVGGVVRTALDRYRDAPVQNFVPILALRDALEAARQAVAARQ